MRTSFILILAAGMLFLSGCLPATVVPESVTVTPTLAASPTPATPTVPSPTMSVTVTPELVGTMIPSEDATRMADLAAQSLAAKLGILSSQITVGSIETVTWPDASLGCPQKGVMYIQVLTPGYNILLETGGGAYVYHTDDTNRVVLCQPTLPDGSVPTIEIPPPRN